MNKTDKQTLDLISADFKANAQKAELPEKLSKENIVAMLKESQKAEPMEIKFEEPAPKNNIIKFRRLAAVAAAFVLILGITAVIRSSDRLPVLGSRDAFKYFESVNPIKIISSDKDYKKAVDEIVGSASESTTNVNPSAKTDNTKKEEKNADYYVENPASSDGSYILAKVDSDTDLTSRSDIVKSDDEFLYVLTSSSDPATKRKTETIKIYRIVPVDGMSEKPVGEIKLYDSENSDIRTECFEIYLNGDTLVALMHRTVSQGTEQTLAVSFNISDPTKRIFCTNECIQQGSYVSSRLQGTKLTLVTKGALSSADNLPEFVLNDQKSQSTNIQKVENKAENSYLFVTVTDLGSHVDTPSSSLLLLGCGGGVTITSNGICVTRTFAAVDSEAKKSEIYRFGSSLTLAGFTVIDGTVVGGANTGNDGYVKAIVSDGKKLSAYTFNTDMDNAGVCESFADAGNVTISYYGNYAYVSGSVTAAVDFTDPINPSVANNSMAVSSADILYRVSDNLLVSVDADGKSVRSFDASGKELSAAEIKGTKVLLDDSRAITVSENGNIIGIPVISTDGEKKSLISAYLLIGISSGKLENSGLCIHDTSCAGDAASRAEIKGDILYTVSGSKIAAHSVTNNSVLKIIPIV